MKNILVIGGAGYIGSHTVKLLIDMGYNVIIYDNLSKGHKEVADILNVKLIVGDLGDRQKLKEVFETEKIDIVMHFAAFIEVGESVQEPAKYYENNVVKYYTYGSRGHSVLLFEFKLEDIEQIKMKNRPFHCLKMTIKIRNPIFCGLHEKKLNKLTNVSIIIDRKKSDFFMQQIEQFHRKQINELI